jgi:hypothetical protein
MATSLSSPADVVNDALRRIGYKLRVGSLLDGSDASNLALDLYGQTRDTMMRDGDWQFAQREVTGTQLKAAPDYFDTPWDPATAPPIGWQFSYTYPADALRIKAVRPQPTFQPDMRPTAKLFDVVNDNGYTPPRRVVVANISSAVLVYVGRVTDPATWSVDFTEALCAGLARRLAPTLANLQVEQVEAQDEAVTTRMASLERG